jgi:hypothetical protein
MTFEAWMKAVDAACYAKAGVSVYDLSDCPFADWYEAGMPPKAAANHALRGDM